MKQMLKETIIVWMVIILISVSVCIVAGAPFLFLHYVGFGDWQIVVCGLWLTFWISLAIVVGIRIERKKVGDKR